LVQFDAVVPKQLGVVDCRLQSREEAFFFAPLGSIVAKGGFGVRLCRRAEQRDYRIKDTGLTADGRAKGLHIDSHNKHGAVRKFDFPSFGFFQGQ
jgi:hypothetical protein